MIEKVIYNRSVIFHELKPSSIDLQLEKNNEEKKCVVEMPLTPKKEELKFHIVIEFEESSSSSESSKEEEPQPHPLPMMRSTCEKKKIKRYGFSMLDENCAYDLITNVD